MLYVCLRYEGCATEHKDDQNYKNNANTHACLHTYIHTYIHTYMHIYIHTYIHTYIHQQKQGNVYAEDNADKYLLLLFYCDLRRHYIT